MGVRISEEGGADFRFHFELEGESKEGERERGTSYPHTPSRGEVGISRAAEGDGTRPPWLSIPGKPLGYHLV